MAMATGDGGGEGAPLCEINVTPMVDVLLCLLIIFMISVPAPPNESIPLSVPTDTAVETPGDPNASLMVTIEENGDVLIGKQKASKNYDEMIEQFRNNEKAQTDSKIVINGKDKSRYGWMIKVMAAAHAAGIEEVGLASKRL
jgi:biopolymer transport protein TolR